MIENLLPCPMCGSKAKIDSTGALECYGKAWQTLSIDCQKDKDEHCGMSLSIEADFWYVKNAHDKIIECWNGLARK